jgi:hypothetical protein
MKNDERKVFSGEQFEHQQLILELSLEVVVSLMNGKSIIDLYTSDSFNCTVLKDT